MNVRAFYDAGYVVIEDELGREIYYTHMDDLKTARGVVDFLQCLGSKRWVSVALYRQVFAILWYLTVEAIKGTEQDNGGAE
jgi:hypothetical protein